MGLGMDIRMIAHPVNFLELSRSWIGKVAWQQALLPCTQGGTSPVV
jgi:hypothetical protein